MIHFHVYGNGIENTLCYYRDDGEFGSARVRLNGLHKLIRFDFFIGTINWIDFIKTQPTFTYFTAADDYTPTQLLADYPELFI